MKKVIYHVILWVSIAGSATLSWMALNKKIKTAYVNIGMLYNEFTMKKEFQKKIQGVEQQRKFVTDSLEIQLKLMSTRIENEKTQKRDGMIKDFELIKQEYLMKKQQFEKDNQEMSQQYTEEITKQMNQYVEEYGKENGYEYIFGAEGSGAIMHANESLDITKEVVQFINGRYQGQGK